MECSLSSFESWSTFGRGLDIYTADNAKLNLDSYTKSGFSYFISTGVRGKKSIPAGIYSFTPDEAEMFYLVKSVKKPPIKGGSVDLCEFIQRRISNFYSNIQSSVPNNGFRTSPGVQANLHFQGKLGKGASSHGKMIE